MKTDTTTLFFTLSSFKMEKWTSFGYWVGVHSRWSISFLACPQTHINKDGFKHYRTACPQSCKIHMVQALEHNPFVYNAKISLKYIYIVLSPSKSLLDKGTSESTLPSTTCVGTSSLKNHCSLRPPPTNSPTEQIGRKGNKWWKYQLPSGVVAISAMIPPSGL